MKRRLIRTGRLLPSLLSLMTATVCAQQQPLTGQMMSGNASASASAAVRRGSPVSSTVAIADDAEPPADTSANHVGDVTRSLLQRQADDQRRGRRLPMLGDEATLAYRRYLRSFNHDIPEFYEAAVGKHAGDGR